MPVRKYRSVEDMPQAALRAPLDPHNLKLACELSAVAARLAPGSFPPVQTEIVVRTSAFNAATSAPVRTSIMIV